MNVTATSQNTATATAGAAPHRADPGGKALPPSGKPAPATEQPLPSASIEKALEQIRGFLKDSQRQLNFQRDEATGRTIIRVIDPASGQVIRQMPSEEILKLAAMIDSKGFHTLNELA